MAAGIRHQGNQMIRVIRPWLEKSPEDILKGSNRGQQPMEGYLEMTQREESWNAIGEVVMFVSSKTEDAGPTEEEDTCSIDANHGSENEDEKENAN